MTAFPVCVCVSDRGIGVDSAEGFGDCLGGGDSWVRGAGLDKAWEKFGPRKV